MAPFDTYSLDVLVFMIERTTNNPMPIVTLTAGQAPDNFDGRLIRRGGHDEQLHLRIRDRADHDKC